MLSNIKYTMNANIANMQFNNMMCINIINPFFINLDMQAIASLHILLIICCYNKIKIKKKERERLEIRSNLFPILPGFIRHKFFS